MSFQLKSYQSIRVQTHIGLLSSVLFAGLTALGAFLVIPLKFTPVPITGQTFFVLLSGFLLGKKYGPLSQFLYVGLGVLGIPWFADGSSGLSVLLGATGGYLIGFVVASFVIGYITEISNEMRKTPIILLLSAIGTLTVYLFGVLGLSLIAEISINSALLLGFFPFIPGDLLKIALVFATATLVLPNGEATTDKGLTKKKWNLFLLVSLIFSILSVFVFVVYLLAASDNPPINLVSYSLLTSAVVIPSIILALQTNKLSTPKEE